MNADTATPTQVNRIAAVQLAGTIIDTDSAAEIIQLSDYLIGEGIFAPDDLETVRDESRRFTVTDDDGDTLDVRAPSYPLSGVVFVAEVRSSDNSVNSVYVPRDYIDALIDTLTNLRDDYDVRALTS